MDSGVATLCRPDGPGGTDIPRRRLGRVVRPLPEAVADGVDGGEVDDVETHGGDGGEAGGRGPEGAAAGWLRPLRPRKHLVPGREPGQLALHAEPPRSGACGGLAVGRAPQQRHRRRPRRLVEAMRLGHAPVAQAGGQGAQLLAVAVGGTGEGRRPFRHPCPLLQLEGDVLARLEAHPEVAEPAPVEIGHRDDLEGPRSDPCGGDDGVESVVAERSHRELLPASGGARAGAGPAMANPPHHQIVAIGEERGADGQGDPDGRLGRERPAFDDGPRLLDDDAGGGHRRWRRHRGCGSRAAGGDGVPGRGQRARLRGGMRCGRGCVGGLRRSHRRSRRAPAARCRHRTRAPRSGGPSQCHGVIRERERFPGL